MTFPEEADDEVREEEYSCSSIRVLLGQCEKLNHGNTKETDFIRELLTYGPNKEN